MSQTLRFRMPARSFLVLGILMALAVRVEAKDDPAAVSFKFRPGKGLEIRTADKRFNLTTRLRAQLLYSLNHESGDGGQTDHSFQLRRARLQFIGNLWGIHNKYKVELAISPRDMGLKNGVLTKTPLLSWFMEFDYLRDLTLRVGQYKVFYSRQRVISSGNLQLVDRSIVNAEFNVDRDIGLDLRSKDLFGLGWLRYYAFVGVGEGRDGFQQDDFGLMYIGRLEILPFGMFKDYSEVDLKRSSKARVGLGVSYAFVDNAKRNRGILGSVPADGGTTDTHNVNADLIAKWRGLSLQTAFMWRHGKRKPGDAVDENGVPVPVEVARQGYGMHFQLGYLLGWQPIEFAARFSFVRPIGNSSLTRPNEAGGAISYYPGGHPFKVQLDYFRIWDNDPAGTDFDRLRLQLQASF